MMKNRAFRKLQSVVLALAMLTTATPAFAGRTETVKRDYDVFLPGVNFFGCLTDCGGKCTTFCAVINCRTGKFSGSAKACVLNLSLWWQCYTNVNFFKDCNVRVECSKYDVGLLGNACYTASGCIDRW